MSMLEAIKSFLTIGYEPPPQARSEEGSIDDLVSRLSGGGAGRAWAPRSVSEALSVPSIFRAVSLISTTIGALSLNAYRNGLLIDPADRPIVMVRPDPTKKPRTFFRDTGWNLATRGEAVWWVAKRDGDGQALSLVNAPPQEVVIEENPDDGRYPWITWRNLTTKPNTSLRTVPREDFRHLTFVQLAGHLRGSGPLQLCGAAVSVAIEAQDFAANFYADGGLPSIGIKVAGELDPTLDADGLSEADKLRSQWVDKPNNVPRVYDQGIDSIEQFGFDPQRYQGMQARDYQTGESARMFGIPGSLLDYSVPGSTLTYQNLEGEFTKWVRAGLWPYYLEEIEQEMSDLLTRSTVARFNLDALERPDIKTRFDVYKTGIESGVLTAEIAQQREGIIPGDIENAPVPFSPPAAALPVLAVRTSEPVRCEGSITVRGIVRRCRKLLAESGPFVGHCERCGKEYAAA